jgi:hypothetical protein
MVRASIPFKLLQLLFLLKVCCIVQGAFEEQVKADRLQGYDYVGYHGYAKRRYYELVGPDYEELCMTAPKPSNTTCSWRGFPERLDKTRTAESWFRGCACFMVNAWE